jgi:serine/threonine protein kinase
MTPSHHTEIKKIRITGYTTQDLIASGGTADVFAGIRDRDGSKVAIKVLNEKFSKDPSVKQRLFREAKVLGQIKHRSLVQIFQYGTLGNRLYMVMEYLGGGALSERENMSSRFRLKTMIQVCDGISFIHSLGIVHRDLKPSNIMFGDDDLPRLVDFGISLFANEDFTRLTHTHLVMGTLAYMSPEQQTSPQDVNHLSDIYSVGVILYELFTGQKPVGRFRDPSKLVQGFPEKLETCILKCLEELPAQRYQNIQDLQRDLIELWDQGLFSDEQEHQKILTYDERVGIWLNQWQHGSSREKLIAKENILNNVQEEDVGTLIETIRNGNDNIGIAVFPALAKLGAPESLDLLLEHLGNPLFTRDICLGLGRIGDSAALPALIRLVKKKTPFSDAALKPIARIGEEKHLKVILPFLKSKDASERKAAVMALSTPKSRKYLKILKKTMQNEKETDIRNLLYKLIKKLELS